MSATTTQVYTAAGARQLDRAAAAEAAARAEQQQVVTREAEAMAQLRIEQARQAAAEQARARVEQQRAEQQARTTERRAERRARRAVRRAQRAAYVRERQPLLVVLPMMATSAAVALPAQFHYYETATHSAWSAAAIAGMVEGGTWLGAALESAAIRHRRPAGLYRVMTWALAGVAAAVNMAHGLTQDGGGLQVGIPFALASLMGAGAWTAYTHLRTRQDSERTSEEIRLVIWRRLRYPRLSWRAASLRAAIGPVLSAEAAWVQVWAEHHAPRPARRPRRSRRQLAATSPIPTGDPIEPLTEATEPVPVEVPVGVESVVEVDPAADGIDSVIDRVPVESGDPFGTLDLLHLVDDLSPALQAVVNPSAPVRPVEARPGVVPVWIEPPLLDQGGPVEVDPFTAAGDDIDPVTEELLADLAEAIDEGELPEGASAEAVRKYLGIAWRTAKALLEERDTRARTAVAA